MNPDYASSLLQRLRYYQHQCSLHNNHTNIGIVVYSKTGNSYFVVCKIRENLERARHSVSLEKFLIQTHQVVLTVSFLYLPSGKIISKTFLAKISLPALVKCTLSYLQSSYLYGSKSSKRSR